MNQIIGTPILIVNRNSDLLLSDNIGMSIGTRIREARRIAKLTQKELASKVGMSQAALSELETGESEGSTLVASIASALGVNALWLESGKGTQGPGPGGLAPGEYQEVEVVHAGNPDVILIPQVKLRLSAGVTGFHVDAPEDGINTYPLDRRWVERGGFAPQRLIAIRVKGESMEPGLYHGDIVVVNTADTVPVDGSVYAINYEGEAVIKRMSRDAGNWWLTSDNPDQRKYHRKSVHGNECIIVGRVVKKESTQI
ncbi:MAG TPA: XRE family transcriptional regulator [Telluria sp.]|jgi:phage repressor protein C with HTH and peptisase S24 domain